MSLSKREWYAVIILASLTAYRYATGDWPVSVEVDDA